MIQINNIKITESQIFIKYGLESEEYETVEEQIVERFFNVKLFMMEFLIRILDKVESQ